MYRITVSRGFTLVELLITIAIATVLMTLAVPSVKQMIEANAVNKHVTTFISDLRYARSEAIKSGVAVVMCRSITSGNAAPTCATGSGGGSATGGWASGWLIFVNRDLDTSNNYNASAGDTLLRVQGVLADSGGIEKTTTPAVNKFVFRPTGLMSAGASSFAFNSVTLTNSQQKQICISVQGRARILKDTYTTCTSGDS